MGEGQIPIGQKALFVPFSITSFVSKTKERKQVTPCPHGEVQPRQTIGTTKGPLPMHLERKNFTQKVKWKEATRKGGKGLDEIKVLHAYKRGLLLPRESTHSEA
ncbi:unnamed protein product [Prunus armeniaca]